MSALTPEQKSEIMLSNIDKSDCGIIALQAITALARPAAEALMRKHGYSPSVGTPRMSLPAALVELGYDFTPVDGNSSGETPATFSVTHEYGAFIIYVEEHVMALVEGDLHNSRGSWRKPVQLVLEVWKPGPKSHHNHTHIAS